MELKLWIDKFFDQTVYANEATLEEIKKFTILWLIFEKYICIENANYDKIESQLDKVNKQNIKSEIYNIALKYFQERYIDEEGKTTSHFLYTFKSTSNEQIKEQRFLKVLKAESIDLLEILKGITFLMYRYRNNLFHGVKDPIRLDDQYENFVHANLFLSNLILFLKSELNIQTT